LMALAEINALFEADGQLRGKPRNRDGIITARMGEAVPPKTRLTKSR
jgi:hypothetical protein